MKVLKKNENELDLDLPMSGLEHAFSESLEIDLDSSQSEDILLIPSALQNKYSSPGGLPSLSPATYTWLQSALLTPSTDVTANCTEDHNPAVVLPSVIDWKAVQVQSHDSIEWNQIPQRKTTVEKKTSMASNISQQFQTIASTITGMLPLASQPTSAEPVVAVEPDMSYSKRKAIISPEFVQYSTKEQLASRKQPIVTKRPSKKVQQQQPDPMTRCKCIGKCRNARCACVKAGLVCGSDCKCEGCRNPFKTLLEYKMDPKSMMQDECLMHNLSKIKDMQERLVGQITLECCGNSIQVHEAAANGYECPKCKVSYTYSWCTNRLCNDSRKPRKHCNICKRCGDHRNQHCFDCGHCYFAGVGDSFSCACSKKMTEEVIRPKETAVLNKVSSKEPVAEPVKEEKASECPVQ